MATLHFKFDESYDGRFMAVGGWIGNESQWQSLEGSWQRRIDRENSRSNSTQQITRYHASHMNCKDGEFGHWEHKRCVQFSRKLIDIIVRRKLGAIATGCDMEAIKQIWPNGEEATLKRRTYVVCMKAMMVDIAHVMDEFFPGHRVFLIHDRGSWDEEALQGYNLMVNDPEWKLKHVFEGIESRSGKDPSAVGLQAADMIVYEVFKGIRNRTLTPEKDMRAVMKQFVQQEVPMIARWIDRKSAEALYQKMKESGKYPDLDNRGLA